MLVIRGVQGISPDANSNKKMFFGIAKRVLHIDGPVSDAIFANCRDHRSNITLLAFQSPPIMTMACFGTLLAVEVPPISLSMSFAVIVKSYQWLEKALLEKLEK